jgi:hypothetical protein
VAEYFGDVDLGHRSRNRCFQRIAEKLSQHPGSTLPDKLSDPNDYHAMDRLMNRPETTHASVLRPHQERTWAKMRDCDGPVLILHDTSVLDYSGKKSLQLPAVGNGNGHGYLCHNALAVDPRGRQVLGLATQILHKPTRVPRQEGVKAKRERASRESRLWSRAVEELPRAPEGRQWLDVADRGADLFEFLATEQRLGRRCLVRSCHNRSIQVGHGEGPKTKLHDHLRSLPAVGEAQRKPVYDRSLKQERTAILRVAYAAVQVLPPHVRRGVYEKKPIVAWGVRVWEESPPAGAAQLEWFLVSLDPVEDAASAWEKCAWYSCRWTEEEYHKALKTGCRIEDLQFHTTAALEPMIALLSVVAVMLLNLREAARRPDAQERLATEIVAPIYEEVLRAQRHRAREEPLTIYEYTLALGRLGGHMNRKRDGLPGWLTLWRGWQKLQERVAAVEIERRRQKHRVES